MLPVTTTAIFESSNRKFHPEGLFSEVIFGQVGTEDRRIRKGYIDLRTKLITPHLFKQIVKLKSYYKDIMSGKEYAIFDPVLKDFVKTTREDPKASTGFEFFVSHLDKIVFQETGSSKRSDRISVINKYRNQLLMDKLVVVPAALRDIRITEGRVSPEEINKYYMSILDLRLALPDNYTTDMLYDSIRYQLQNKVMQIYTYLQELMDGKGGFGQSKYSSRKVVGGSRNVITAPDVSATETPDSPNSMKNGEVLYPLFQALKSATPLVVNKLTTGLLSNVFDPTAPVQALIDADTFKLTYVEVDTREMDKFTTSDGINDLINDYRNPEVYFKPVSVNGKVDGKIKPYYILMVYATDTDVYFFRNIDDFKSTFGNKLGYTTANLDMSMLDRFPKDEFILMGSSATNVFGRPYYPKDRDILVSDRLFTEIQQDPKYTKNKSGVYRDDTAGIEIYNERIFGDKRTNFEEYKSKTIEVDGYMVLKPEEVLVDYKASNRLKDKNVIKFLDSIIFNPLWVRPITYTELFYVTAYAALHDKYTTTTRHPVFNLEGLALFKIHLMSTVPSRIVTVHSESGATYTLPEYPRLDSTIKASLSVHPSTLAKFDGDHDGDVLGTNILFSDESNKEVADYFESPISMVDHMGKLIYGLSSSKNVKFVLFANTWFDLGSEVPENIKY